MGAELLGAGQVLLAVHHANRELATLADLIEQNGVWNSSQPFGTSTAGIRGRRAGEKLREGEYPEPSLNEFQGGEDFDDEYARLGGSLPFWVETPIHEPGWFVV